MMKAMWSEQLEQRFGALRNVNRVHPRDIKSRKLEREKRDPF